MKTNYSISRAPSGIFYLWYYDNQAKRQKISTGCRLKAEAKAFAIKFLKGEVVPAKAKRSVKTILEFKTEYIKHKEKHSKPKTTHDVKSCFGEFLKWLENDNLPLKSISVKMVQDFIDHKQSTTTVATARRIYTGLSAAFRSAQTWGYIESNPFKSVKKPKLIERKPLWISVKDFVALLGEMAKDIYRDHRLLQSGKLNARQTETVANRKTLYELVVVAFSTGLRSGEIRNLQHKAIDFERRQLLVENTDEFTTKNNRERIIPLTKTCMQIFLSRLNNRTVPESLVFPMLYHGKETLMGESYVSHRFKQWIIRAGLNPAFRLHDLRHSFASNLVASGTPLFHVQKLLGHEDAKTTQIYSHLGANDLKQAVEVLDISSGDGEIDLEYEEQRKREMQELKSTKGKATIEELEGLVVKLQAALQEMKTNKA